MEIPMKHFKQFLCMLLIVPDFESVIMLVLASY